jgi:hypothetical protein
MAQLARLSARFAHIHPVLFLGLCLGWLMVPNALRTFSFSTLCGVLFLLSFIVGPLWAHGIYSASVLAKGGEARWQIVFVASETLCLLTAVSFFIAPVPDGEMVAAVSRYLAYAFFGLQLVAWWLAARAFVAAARRQDHSPRLLHNTAAIYWLLWAAPIGVWVLRSGIRDLKRPSLTG